MLQITSNLLTQDYRYHKLRKTFGTFIRSFSHHLSKFDKISFQKYVSEGISNRVFYADLVYKLRRVKCEANSVSLGSWIFKRFRRRKYGPAIIERTIGLVCLALLQPCIDHSLSVALWLTRRHGLYVWPCLNPSQRRQVPDPHTLWLLVGTHLAFEPELAYRLRVAQPTLIDVPRYFWYNKILLYVFVYNIFMTSPLWLTVVLSLYKEDY